MSPLLEVGRIDRPHGVKGDVLVRLTTNRPERLVPGSVLHADDELLTVGRSRVDGRRYVVSFQGVADRASAERLRGRVLRAEPLSDPGILWVHELVGALVVTTGGEQAGEVVAVEANPASDLMQTDRGHLVPLRFVVAVEEPFEGGGTRRVVVDVPDGLLG
jgi:16S rRNA processing protein RimM